MGQVKRQRGLIRQWQLVRALEAHPRGMTFRQLQQVPDEAACLKTIRRDIDTLTIAGFQIDVVTGENTTKVYLRQAVQ